MAEGREVTLVEESKKLGNGIGVVDRKPTINALKGKGVKTLTCTKVKEIKKNGILVENTETYEQTLIGMRHDPACTWSRGRPCFVR